MQPTISDPRFIFDIQEDPQTGECEATIPALNLSQRGTFDEVSEWALEQLAQHFGVDTQASSEAKS